MFNPQLSFSGFSVLDLNKTKDFYGQTLGLKLEEEEMGLKLTLPGSNAEVFIYQKDDHQPATFTILNFIVENIDQSIKELKAKGIEFIQYNRDDLPQDEFGVLRGLSANMGPDIAWFEDPSGNVLSILQEK